MQLPETKTLLSTLKTYFGYDQFRPQQQAIIEHILAGKDTLVIMPTGGGKSLCYQLPAVLLSGITLVISPLIALMKDQVDSLQQNGIQAAFYNSQQNADDRLALKQALTQKQIKLLYCAPESAQALLSMLEPANISLLAVDEAHCISSWGHDFRPAYTQLAELRKQLNCPLIALTATADKATRQDICTQLNMPDAKLFLSSFNRQNLSLNVASGQDRMAQVSAFLKRHKDESGIIYCLSRNSTEKLAYNLSQNGYKAEAYHAGLDSHTREQVQNRFINDDTPIVCATIAFGMGIDKSNVRWVIHYNLPKNIESYYQEIGRAGRDGIEAETLLFYSYADVAQLRKFSDNSPEQQQEIQLAKLERMQQYAEALTCRRKILLSYFGEYLAEDCQNCDICLHPPAQIDGTVIAQKALSAIARLKQNEPMKVVIDLLRGAHNQNITKHNYQKLKTHGAGKDIAWRDWQQYLIQLINQGYIEINYRDQNKLELTEASQAILTKQQTVTLAKLVDAQNRLKEQTKNHQPAINPMFNMLKALRKQLADEKGIPAFTIFSDASLHDMVAICPQNNSQFLQVSGVGQAKLEKYGEHFIQAIKSHLSTHEKPNIQASERLIDVNVKPPKSKTVDTTCDLYEQGLMPEDIAEERNLNCSTIITHLCRGFQQGKPIDLLSLISKDTLNTVKQAKIELDNPSTLTAYYQHFNQNISYDDIKLALFILAEDIT